MRLLLDTATLLWIATDSPRLSARAQAVFADHANEVYVSAVSIWEILVKQKVGKLPLPLPCDELIRPLTESDAIAWLSLTPRAAYQLSDLPDHHRDPFDRMLVCQAIDESLAILTPDAQIAEYPVQVIW